MVFVWVVEITTRGERPCLFFFFHVVSVIMYETYCSQTFLELLQRHLLELPRLLVQSALASSLHTSTKTAGFLAISATVLSLFEPSPSAAFANHLPSFAVPGETSQRTMPCGVRCHALAATEPSLPWAFCRSATNGETTESTDPGVPASLFSSFSSKSLSPPVFSPSARCPRCSCSSCGETPSTLRARATLGRK